MPKVAYGRRRRCGRHILIGRTQRTGLPNGDKGSLAYYNWSAYEFWRFVNVLRQVAELARTAIEFPPMQKGASFNLEAVKAQIELAIKAYVGE